MDTQSPSLSGPTFAFISIKQLDPIVELKIHFHFFVESL